MASTHDMDAELKALQTLRGALNGVNLMVTNVEKDFQVMIANYDKHKAVNARWAQTLQLAPPPQTTSFTQESPMDNQ